jgi:hypothetical protein
LGVVFVVILSGAKNLSGSLRETEERFFGPRTGPQNDIEIKLTIGSREIKEREGRTTCSIHWEI